jgi:glucosamine-phosphate N-acetyltransferase
MIQNIKKIELTEINYNQICELYSIFKKINKNIFSFDKLKEIIKNLPDNHNIYLFFKDNEIIGAITLIIEQKIIHDGKCVGHIEDYVIKEEHRKTEVSSMLLNYVKILCEQNNCYKIILDCNPLLEEYYNKKGYKNKGIYMAYYF